MIRVLVAEDSSTARRLLVAILESDPRLTVIGEAKNGVEAIEMTKRLRPDVVTMDIHMPLLDGVEATRRIMMEVPTPVVVVSGIKVLEVETSMEALRAGALVVIEKPEGPAVVAFEERCRALLDNVKLMAAVKVVRRFPRQVAGGARAAAIGSGRREPVRAIVIASSTGGPACLQAIFSRLPPDFPVPVLVVQHIAKGFVSGFATWLNDTSMIRVKIADPDERMAPGTAYLAPEDRHLGMTPTGRILVSTEPEIDGFRPSGTFLFESAARGLGAAALALILTGMGRDGVEGLRRLKAVGGRIIAQDEASSVVFGMPGAAIEAGLADEIVALDDLAGRIVELVA
jgi:two-component system, chemotaxis family, protein-glutamate methylesterase/glutaminase